jgi:putative hydrolase of the HAD superfamily
MKRKSLFTTLFLDIGGVLLTDGWNHNSRELAAAYFDLDFKELEQRHRIVFETFEEGRISMNEYLDLVIFYKKRTFSKSQFRRFMLDQSKPYPAMIRLMADVKSANGLKVAIVSNEACELNSYRLNKFKLDDFVDFYISSCYVHLRKPDPEIFRLALNIAHVPPEQALYIDNQPLFVQTAEKLGIRSFHHIDYNLTLEFLASMDLLPKNKIIKGNSIIDSL